MSESRFKIGDVTALGRVMALGIKDGERWVMTIDEHGVVGLWPEGTWEALRI